MLGAHASDQMEHPGMGFLFGGVLYKQPMKNLPPSNTSWEFPTNSIFWGLINIPGTEMTMSTVSHLVVNVFILFWWFP